MGDGQEPLHKRHPPIEIAFGVGIGVVQVYGRVVGGGGVAVVHENQVSAHPVAKPLQLQVPVEPPSGILLAEEDHEQGTEEQLAAHSRCT